MSDNQDLNRRALLATAGVVGVGALAATQAHAQTADQREQPASVRLGAVKIAADDSTVNIDLPNVTWRAIRSGGSIDITVPIDLGGGKTLTLKCYPFGLQGAVSGSINGICF